VDQGAAAYDVTLQRYAIIAASPVNAMVVFQSKTGAFVVMIEGDPRGCGPNAQLSI